MARRVDEGLVNAGDQGDGTTADAGDGLGGSDQGAACAVEEMSAD